MNIRSIFESHPEYLPHKSKYLNWYMNIVSDRKETERDGVSERHHILPRAIFPEHERDSWNLVSLTPREHFICHYLMTKFMRGSSYYKSLKAVSMFAMNGDGQKRTMTSREYQIIRESHSESMKIYNPFRGRTMVRNGAISHLVDKDEYQKSDMKHINYGRVVIETPEGKRIMIDKEEKDNYSSFRYPGLNNPGFVCAKNVVTGENIKVDQETFDKCEELVGQTKGKAVYMDKQTGKIISIDPHLAKEFPDRYIAPAKGRVSVRLKSSGETMSISKEEYDANPDLYEGATTGTIFVSDGSGKILSIQENDLEEYIAKGWTRGNDIVRDRMRNSFWVTKNGENVRIKTEDLEKFLSDGWVRGRNTKGNKIMNKDGKTIQVKSESVEDFLNEGWSLGSGKKSKRTPTNKS